MAVDPLVVNMNRTYIARDIYTKYSINAILSQFRFIVGLDRTSIPSTYRIHEPHGPRVNWPFLLLLISFNYKWYSMVMNCTSVSPWQCSKCMQIRGPAHRAQTKSNDDSHRCACDIRQAFVRNSSLIKFFNERSLQFVCHFANDCCVFLFTFEMHSPEHQTNLYKFIVAFAMCALCHRPPQLCNVYRICAIMLIVGISHSFSRTRATESVDSLGHLVLEN